MSITASDLVMYASANMPEANGTTSGGAIDLTTKVEFDSTSLANSLNDTVDVVSSSGADTTQVVTVYGRNAAGTIVSENFNLNGVTIQNGATTFERIEKVVIDAPPTGTVTVKDNGTVTTIATLNSNINAVRRMFYDSAADAAGGSSRDFYEKVFIKNEHGTLSLLSATIQENADPGANITFDLEDAVNDNNSVADRLNTPPTGMLGSFDGADKAVPGTDLAAGSAIGIWLKLTLAAGAAAAVNTYTVRATGQST